MADTLVETSIVGDLDTYDALWGPYWIDASKGLIVFLDAENDLSFARTIDKGANWATTEVEAGTAFSVAVWFDQETPGDAGTLVNVAWTDFSAGALYYITIDISDGSEGTKRTIDGSITVDGTPAFNRLSITKTVSGNLIVAFSTQTEIACHRSTDGFNTSNDVVGDVFETTTEEDWVLLFPANTGDNDDACAIFWDRSVNDITIKMYDESDSGSWTEFATAIDASATEDPIHRNIDGAVRHSDNHVLLAYHNNDDNATDDIETFDLTVASISTPVITAKADVVTNQAESAQVSVFINQQNDYVYVAYLKGGTWQAEVDVVYHYSTDGMANWESESAYSEDTIEDRRIVSAGRTVGDSGGRFQPSFYDHDDNDIFINQTLDVEIAAAGAAAMPQSMDMNYRRRNA